MQDRVYERNPAPAGPGSKVTDVTKPVTKNRKAAAARNAIVPTLFAVGGSMAVGSAGALELGDIEVASALGEPLRASIAFALGPNEELQKYCVSISGSASSSGVPTVANPRIDIGDGRITVTSRRAIREPIVSTRLTVNCPYTPHFTREYTMFLSPPGLETRNPAPAAQRPQQPAPATSRASDRVMATGTQATAPRPPAEPIQQGSQYRVQAGDYPASRSASRIDRSDFGRQSTRCSRPIRMHS